MMSCYKKYWFVLEGRLLLYYKSKDEYDAISPCKGSITLGPTSNVKPCSPNTGVFQIESKTTTITLVRKINNSLMIFLKRKFPKKFLESRNQRGPTQMDARIDVGIEPGQRLQETEPFQTFCRRIISDIQESPSAGATKYPTRTV